MCGVRESHRHFFSTVQDTPQMLNNRDGHVTETRKVAEPLKGLE